ncbi:hypothetical protein [Eubacterium barkeri]|uniref:Uncharacterized protein n=1 Tax=Eubacterium barkeri TaxID=1528 RepID=A0A1H3HEW2_EUBBA|nr:hypothetical protein [Eubacterium barkeri]SDY13314.1 hypothetical protein SAMN04488579_11747 [Eubacterium barkeri]
MKIFAPNESYAGISAGVCFSQGVGETENPIALEWFQRHGYVLEKDLKKAKAKEKPAAS